MQIVNFWYELARQNKAIKSFMYGKNGAKGAGNEKYPLTHLDDPILGRSQDTAIQYTCNIDILGIPNADASVQDVQAAAFEVGLSYWQKIRELRGPFRVESFTFISLSEYYDNDAAGHRFTFAVISANPINRCTEYFDPAKQFPLIDALPDFKTDAPEGCAVFSEKNGLPNFTLD